MRVCNLSCKVEFIWRGEQNQVGNAARTEENLAHVWKRGSEPLPFVASEETTSPVEEEMEKVITGLHHVGVSCCRVLFFGEFTLAFLCSL